MTAVCGAWPGARWTLPATVGLVLACGDSRPGPDAAADPPVIEVGGDPVWQVGKQEGSPEEMFHWVMGGKRLSDGSVVVGVAGMAELRRYGPDGSHQWSWGRSGEAPGEFHALELLAGCTDDDGIVVYDRRLARMTEFGGEGGLRGTWNVPTDRGPPFHFVCGPEDRLIFHPQGVSPRELGISRWRVPVAWAGRDGQLHVLREDVPGPEREMTANSFHERRWSRVLVFAGPEEGVWMGSGDDYALELVGWDGASLRTLSWEGPDLTVTQEHVDALFERLAARRGSDPEAREAYRREGWLEERQSLPDRLPAYSRLLLTGDELWVGLYTESWIWREPNDPGRTWLVFDREGRPTREVRVPGNMSLLDAGEDWVLVVTRDELGVERVAVHETG